MHKRIILQNMSSKNITVIITQTASSFLLSNPMRHVIDPSPLKKTYNMFTICLVETQ
jgi:hypothetical protein